MPLPKKRQRRATKPPAKMNSPPNPSNFVLLGAIGSPRGVNGDVRIKSFTTAPKDIASYGLLWNADATQSFKVTVIGIAKEMVIARIKGVNSRDTALSLKGLELYVPREALPTPEEDVFYHWDLVGLTVETKAGECLGLVEAVSNFGAGDVLEISNGPYKGLIIPFTRDVVPDVDIKSGRLIVDPPEGLLETPEDETRPEQDERHRRCGVVL